MRIFISLTAADGSGHAFDAVAAVVDALRSRGHHVSSMTELTAADHARLGMSTLNDFMTHAFAEIEQADAVLCMVTGPRVGPGALLEVGYARGAGVRVWSAYSPDADRYLSTQTVDLGTFSTSADLVALLEQADTAGLITSLALK